MVTDTPKIDTQLLPDRYPQQELFICDVADAVLKDVMQHMEHPFYSLSKKPDTAIRRYEHKGNYIEITPSVKGLATIYDKDILIYCISQIMDKLKRGEKVSQRVKINSYDLLVFTNRGVGGKDYKAFSEALDRLAGTRIKTNIRTGNEEQEDNFGLVDATSIKRTHGLDGRLLSCEIKLSDWVFNAIKAEEVLTLHPDYFRLRKPLERRIYEVARKHCGQQKEWSIFIENLHKKAGSRSPLKRFRQLVKGVSNNPDFPDYSVTLEDDKVIFRNKENMENWYSPKQASLFTEKPKLKPDTLEKAKKVAQGYDIYALYNQWLEHWANTGQKKLDNPDGAFIGFCKKKPPLY
jgi:plasmid replication initiation protein